MTNKLVLKNSFELQLLYDIKAKASTSKLVQPVKRFSKIQKNNITV